MTAANASRDLDSHTEGASTPADGARPRSKWRRRLLWGLGIAVGGVGLLAVGAIAFVKSDAGAAWIVERGVQGYDASVPGSVSYAQTEGNFDDGVVLSALALKDSAGRVLVSADKVAWAVSPIQALRGDVDIRNFELAGTTIVLPADDEPGYADLRRPPRPDEQKEASDDGGALSGSFAASVHIADVQVRQRTAPDQSVDETELLVDLQRFDLDVEKSEGKATLNLGLQVDVPMVEGLRVERLDASLSYAKPVLALDKLELQSSWGSLRMADLRIDRSHGWAELGQSTVAIDPAALQTQLGLSLPKAPKLVATGRLDLAGSDFKVEADLGAAGEATWALRSTPFPKLGVSTTLEAALHLDVLRPDEGLGDAQLTLATSASQIEGGQWGVDASFACSGCEGAGSKDGASAELTLRTGATPNEEGSPKAGPTGQLTANFAGAKLTLDASTVRQAEPDEAPNAEAAAPRFSFDAQLSIASMTRFQRALARWGVQWGQPKPAKSAAASEPDDPAAPEAGAAKPATLRVRCLVQFGAMESWCVHATADASDTPENDAVPASPEVDEPVWGEGQSLRATWSAVQLALIE